MAPTDRRPEDPDAGSGLRRRLWAAGRTGWAIVGVAVVALLGGLVVSRLTLVVVPVVLALFPATLLVPVTDWLKRRGLPDALAALLVLVGALALLVVLVGTMVPLVAAQLPDLASSAGDGLQQGRQFLADRFGVEVEGVSDVVDQVAGLLGEAGDVAGQALAAAAVAFETIAGVLLLLVVLFFYLKDGTRLADGLLELAPRHRRALVRELAERAWTTLGAFFRGQLLIALVDAVVIGIGLLLLGVPLALPLSVLIFFGGLFPIVGAVTTGALAVLVGLADGGLVTGLIVLGLVLAVQQLEGNVLEPLIMGRVVSLHPLVVVLAVTGGAITLGILGAFLAVPAAAILARTVEHLRRRSGDHPNPAGDDPAVT